MENTRFLPKVSVLISVYNQLHCMSKALESALNQDYANLEIVIGDDFSTDGNVQHFVEAYQDKRIQYFRNEQNLGVYKNYQRLLNPNSSGVYAILLNADDYWTDPSFISQAVAIFQEDPDVELVFGDVKVYIEGNHTFYEDQMHKELPKISAGNQFFIQYNKGYSLPHLSCIYKRKRALELNFYENEGISEDWGSLLKIIIGKKIGYISSNVGVITKHLQNYTKSTNLPTILLADHYIEDLYEFANKTNTFDPKSLEIWKFQMLKRHHIKWLVKLWFLDRAKIPPYKTYIKTKHPKIFASIHRDIRYLGYLSIRRSPFLLKWVFRTILKQESFVADLLVHKKMKNEL